MKDVRTKVSFRPIEYVLEARLDFNIGGYIMIRIPENFKKILAKNNELEAAIEATITGDFFDIINLNKLDCFPEYTNHGVKHINKVLEYADKLIHNESRLLITPEEISVLILSVLFHDLGMHLSLDGFFMLIWGDDKRIISEIDYDSWEELWNKFFTEIKKYSDKQLVGIFGHIKNFTHIPRKISDVTNEDRLLFGEFLRKHHPRLAHEIARFGYPCVDNSRICIQGFFKSAFDKELIEISGFVARSHGMNLRGTYSYLEEKYTRSRFSKPNGIRIFYLMILLRIADYLDAGFDRAPHIFRKITNINSPFSKVEWDWNLAVNPNYSWEFDTESIYIEAMPQNSNIFLKIKDWLKSLQVELDTSWAVLGEIYGIKEDTLKLSIRRIASNILDNTNSFKSKFYPDKMVFSSHPDLIKLLIAPLYKNEPTYGIRELIQNAVDACNSKKYIENQNGYNYIGEINVFINEHNDSYEFIIQDNGIGMDIEIIQNYYLKVGSSFRRSYEWLNDFTDTNSKPYIMRNGRFGIGVLASFLLGNKLKVTTKSNKSKYAYFFEASVDDEQIDVKTITSDLEGTKIEIEMTKYSFDRIINPPNVSYAHGIKWTQWYCLNDPKVNYYINNIQVYSNKIAYSDKPKWYFVKQSECEMVCFTYDVIKNFEDILIYNGFIIPESHYSFNNLNEIYACELDVPSLYIIDYKGCINLNLTRDSVDGELPFVDSLYKQLVEFSLYHIICTDNIGVYDRFQVKKNKFFTSVSLYNTRTDIEKQRGCIIYNNYILRNDGFFPFNLYFMKNLGYNKFTLVIMTSKGAKSNKQPLYNCISNNLNVLVIGESILPYQAHFQIDFINHMKIINKQIILFNRYNKNIRKELDKSETFISGKAYGKYSIINISDEIDTYLSLITQYKNDIEMIIECELDLNYVEEYSEEEYFKKEHIEKNKAIYENVMDNILNGKYIFPYDLNIRKFQFKSLINHMESLEVSLDSIKMDYIYRDVEAEEKERSEKLKKFEEMESVIFKMIPKNDT